MSAPPRRRPRGLILAGLGVVVVVGVLVAVILSVIRSDGSVSLTPIASRPAAPAVTFTLAGERRSLASFRGRTVVIGFVEPYCATCIDALHALDAVARAHPDGAVVPVALNVGAGGPGELRRFGAQIGATGPVFAADPGLRVAGAFGVQELETILIIDPDGRIALRAIGPSQGALLGAVSRA